MTCVVFGTRLRDAGSEFQSAQTGKPGLQAPASPGFRRQNLTPEEALRGGSICPRGGPNRFNLGKVAATSGDVLVATYRMP